jgi:hypothetical protein
LAIALKLQSLFLGASLAGLLPFRQGKNETGCNIAVIYTVKRHKINNSSTNKKKENAEHTELRRKSGSPPLP